MHHPSDMIFEVEATITERGQTTVPASIRRVLGLELKGAIIFKSLADGTVLVEPKRPPEDDDPVLGSFLDFLERDMLQNPQSMQPITKQLHDEIGDLVSGVDVDLQQRLNDD